MAEVVGYIVIQKRRKWPVLIKSLDTIRHVHNATLLAHKSRPLFNTTHR